MVIRARGSGRIESKRTTCDSEQDKRQEEACLPLLLLVPSSWPRLPLSQFTQGAFLFALDHAHHHYQAHLIVSACVAPRQSDLYKWAGHGASQRKRPTERTRLGANAGQGDREWSYFGVQAGLFRVQAISTGTDTHADGHKFSRLTSRHGRASRGRASTSGWRRGEQEGDDETGQEGRASTSLLDN